MVSALVSFKLNDRVRSFKAAVRLSGLHVIQDDDYNNGYSGTRINEYKECCVLLDARSYIHN